MPDFLHNRFLEDEGLCGEGVHPRWTAQRSQKLSPCLARLTALDGFATASQPNGGKPPRHGIWVMVGISLVFGGRACKNNLALRIGRMTGTDVQREL